MQNPMLRSVFRVLIFSALIGNAALSIVRAISNSVASTGGIDFHAYWRGGLLFRQQIDPWNGTMDSVAVDVPVTHLIGSHTEVVPVPPFGYVERLGITAPLELVVMGLTWFSWDVAKVVWLAFNLVAWGVAPYLVVRLGRQYGIHLSTSGAWIVGLLFWGMLASRVVIGNGQSTIIVVSLMLGAMLLGESSSRRNRIAGGLLLGFALSKPTIALAALPILGLRRRFDVIVIGLSVQLLGVIAAAAISRSNPFSILHGYLRVLQHHGGIDNVMNVAQSPLTLNQSRIGLTLVAIGTLTILVLLRHSLIGRIQETTGNGKYDFDLFALIAIWSLLATYHWFYDAVLVIPVLVIGVAWLEKRPWPPEDSTGWFGSALVAICLAIPLIPGNILTPILPSYWSINWEVVLTASYTVVLLVLIVFISLRLRHFYA